MKMPPVKLRSLALIIVSVTTIILGLTQYIVHFNFFNTIVSKFENETFEVMENNLESMLEYPIATGNREVIDDVASKLVLLEFVYSIEIRNEDGEILSYKIDETIPVSEGIPLVTKKIEFYRSYISGFDGVDDSQETPQVMGSARISMTNYQAKLFFSKNLRVHAVILLGVLLIIVFMILLFTGYFERHSRLLIAMLNRIAKRDYSEIENTSHVVEIKEITSGVEALAATLQSQFDSLEGANKYKSMMLDVMTHELNQPLNTLKPLLELLHKQSTELNPILSKQVSICLSATDQLCGIVDRVAHFSRLDSSDNDKRFSLMMPESLFDDIFELYQAQNNKKLDFKVTAAVGEETIGNTAIYTDRTMLTQIVSNLLSNAFKFTSSGFVHLDWFVEQQHSSCFLKFSVRDSGIGIKEENLDQIFSDYFREDKGTTGLGIGLSLVKAYVSELGGEIELTSKRDLGTCVSISIPVSVSKPESNTEKLVVESRLNCLVVDDNQNNAFAIDALLSSYGLRSQYLTSPQEAVELVKNTSFDLIMVDYAMPGMTGIQLAETLKYAATPIVIVTAHSDPDLMRKIDKLIDEKVIYRCMSKPLSHDKLKALIAELLQSERTTKSLIDNLNQSDP